ncbi:MAG: PKD domain-containing protein [Flavobacteriia bacterium]
MKKSLQLIVAAVAFITSTAYSIACDCQMNATASGLDFDLPTATIDNFACAAGTINSASLNWNIQGTCTWSQARIIVDGVQVANGLCGSGTFDLTPYLPLVSVQVVGYDNPADQVADFITVNAVVTLNGSATNTAPIIAFDAPDYECAGTPLQFLNNSTCAYGYNWSFGDGTTSNQFEPLHVFTEPGYYYVQLQTFGATGNVIGSEYNYVVVSGAPNSMYVSQDTVCVGDEVIFHDNAFFNSTNNVSYVINYGDGTSETANTYYASFYHDYAATGNYQVTLTITSDCGTDIIDTLIHVGDNIPINDGLIQVGNIGQGAVCPGTEVNLYTNWNYTYLFNYGDGTTGTDYSHIYNSYGTYTPWVTLQNGCGNTAQYFASPIVVGNVPYFTGDAYANVQGPNNVCIGSTVLFSSPSATNYNWNFGDGGYSNLGDPSHTFNAAGVYNVGLTLTDGCGNDTLVFTTLNVLTDLPVDPQVELSDLPSQICIGDAFVYGVSGAWQYEESGSFLWNFGDGSTSDTRQGYHTYASGGTYTVTCTITNLCGNDTTLVTTVTAGSNVPPQNVQIFTIQQEFCPGDEIMLLSVPYSASNSVVWNMGNGQTVSANDTLALNIENSNMVFSLGTYSYSDPGVYNAQATITNGCGLSVTEDIILTIAPGSQIEDAGFFIEENEYICLNEPVVFRGYGGNEFFWSFGDNSGIELSSNALEPVTHSFDQPGTYTVTMIARNNCGDTVMVQRNITIPDSQMTIITNSTNSNCLESDGTAVAYVAGPNAPYTYAWSNGATTNIISSVPAGIYIVNVTDNKGCTSFALATVSDAQAPTIAVSNVVEVSCNGEDNGAIDITPIGNTSGITYAWSNGETTQDINGLVSGPYEVLVTNGQGCVSVESVFVPEPDGVEIEFSKTNATCGMMNGTATAVVTGSTGPYVYIWSNGNTGAQSTGLAAGFYSVTVIDNNSCTTQGSVAISESTSPGIILDSLLDVGCGTGGSGIYISPIGGTAPYTYSWSTGAATDDVSGLSPGQYTLTITGANNCESNAIYTIAYETPEQNPICVVTVTNSQNNKIAWEKVASSGVASYNIYKESSAAGLYYLVGNIPYDSLSIFIDTISNPAVQAYRYKIAAVDNCGTESVVSAQHKTIHLTQNIGIGGEVNLIWDNYEGFSYATYNILRYDDQGGWQILTSLPSNVNSYSDLAAPLATATSLHYLIEIELDQPCVSTKVENNNTTRSNRTEAVSGPLDDVGLEELIAESEIHVYPNPTQDDIHVYLNVGDFQNVNCQLIDAQGRIVHEILFNQIENGQEITIDPKTSETGIYTVRIDTGERIYHRRVMIQK